MKIWKKDQVALGTGVVHQRTVFEHKKLFSIWVYTWDEVHDQMRFHTHAFNSVAFLLRGRYTQQVMLGPTVDRVATQCVCERGPRFLPRNYCHKIVGAEKGTKSIVFAGPWSPHWAEFFEDTGMWVVYGWGREKVFKTNMPDIVSSFLNRR